MHFYLLSFDMISCKKKIIIKKKSFYFWTGLLLKW